MDRLIAHDEMWTDYLEEINKLLHEEKAARHENDAIKISEIVQRIVSTPHTYPLFPIISPFWLS
jgi:hypothetical protein